MSAKRLMHAVPVPAAAGRITDLNILFFVFVVHIGNVINEHRPPFLSFLLIAIIIVLLKLEGNILTV